MNPPDWAAKFIGIPYKTHGRSRNGADCWYVVYLIMKEQFGIEIPSYDGMSFDKGANNRIEICEFMAQEKIHQWRKISPGEERPGDAILFNMLGVPIHVGIICASGLFIHCEHGSNSCIERYGSGTWSRRIEGFYRHINTY